MRELVQQYLDHATDTLDDANFLNQHGKVLLVANRSYYAIFYCISALLAAKGIFAKSHSGIHSKFNEAFVRTGVFDKNTSTIVNRCFEARQAADYDMDAVIDEAQAQMLLDSARTFYDLTLAYLQQHILQTD